MGLREFVSYLSLSISISFLHVLSLLMIQPIVCKAIIKVLRVSARYSSAELLNAFVWRVASWKESEWRWPSLFFSFFSFSNFFFVKGNKPENTNGFAIIWLYERDNISRKYCRVPPPLSKPTGSLLSRQQPIPSFSLSLCYRWFCLFCLFIAPAKKPNSTGSTQTDCGYMLFACFGISVLVTKVGHDGGREGLPTTKTKQNNKTKTVLMGEAKSSQRDGCVTGTTTANRNLQPTTPFSAELSQPLVRDVSLSLDALSSTSAIYPVSFLSFLSFPFFSVSSVCPACVAAHTFDW